MKIKPTTAWAVVKIEGDFVPCKYCGEYWKHQPTCPRYRVVKVKIEGVEEEAND